MESILLIALILTFEKCFRLLAKLTYYLVETNTILCHRYTKTMLSIWSLVLLAIVKLLYLSIVSMIIIVCFIGTAFLIGRRTKLSRQVEWVCNSDKVVITVVNNVYTISDKVEKL